MIASCHCGAVALEVAAPPASLNECQCSICRRYAVRWAYYDRGEVTLRAAPDATEPYIWGDRQIAFHRCRACGCVTHWADLDPREPRMGINGRLFDPADVAGVPVEVTPGPP